MESNPTENKSTFISLLKRQTHARLSKSNKHGTECPETPQQKGKSRIVLVAMTTGDFRQIWKALFVFRLGFLNALIENRNKRSSFFFALQQSIAKSIYKIHASCSSFSRLQWEKNRGYQTLKGFNTQVLKLFDASTKKSVPCIKAIEYSNAKSTKKNRVLLGQEDDKY
ncbi:hypothetical protein CEXT_8211 [Caerostris extrusa]|uniref:Ribosomal protein L20 n=1 Tax=Caerostris extrusa TaxID=172846 RepID=A0AAV4Q6E1_CAEEX|nr:hypothetical protein CEXT_8211 [Caerostris extrusa]